MSGTRLPEVTFKSTVILITMFLMFAMFWGLSIAGKVRPFGSVGIDPSTGQEWVATPFRKYAGYGSLAFGMTLCGVALYVKRRDVRKGG